jgi:sulfite reductase beta subunit-like hemoprotein
MELYPWLPTAKVLPCVLGTLRFFHRTGDRSNRRRARLRHVRERMGDSDFAHAVREEIEAVLAEQDWPGVDVLLAPPGKEAQLTLTFPNGHIPLQAAEAFATLAGQLDLQLNNRHGVVAFGPDAKTIRNQVQTYAALQPALPGRRPTATVVACPGTKWCKLALADTNTMANAVRRRFADRLPPGSSVCISGCPNGCAHTAVADFGLRGGRKDGESRFRLLVGGGNGRTHELAEPATAFLSPEQILQDLDRRLQETSSR